MDGTKRDLRKRYASARRAIPADMAERWSFHVIRNIVSLRRILDSKLILVYRRAGSEVNTDMLIDLIIASGRGAALPYCREDGSMGIGRILSPDTDLAPGALGVMEPVAACRDNVRPDQLDAVICPGVAFDTECGRLGRGGGYYDRFLQQVKGSAFVVGCAYDCQISETPLPRQPHDVAMDAVITEKRAFPAGVCPALAAPGGAGGERA